MNTETDMDADANQIRTWIQMCTNNATDAKDANQIRTDKATYVQMDGVKTESDVDVEIHTASTTPF
jgi:hypothetical protein